VRHLAEAWLRDTAAAGARGDVAGAGADLLGRWTEPHRRYHDLAHLDAVLRAVDDLGAEAGDVPTVRLAAWFHDAVYDPHAADNEDRSADLATRVLAGLRVPDDRVADVARLVRLTSTHAPEPHDADGTVLCDADLSVLAGSPESYRRYADAVREEYAHLSDVDFARGRRQVLRSLLDRPALFRTTHGRTTWEPVARENLTDELARLG
jgi:predicted metal-dependent HD superfamily phosphohydrolase